MSQPPSPDTRIATAPASGPVRHQPDPGHSSQEHRLAWLPTEAPRGILPRGGGGWIANGHQPADPRACGGAAC